PSMLSISRQLELCSPHSFPTRRSSDLFHMSKLMAFEEPIVKLRDKIAELKTIAVEAEVDMSGEIEKLENRLQQLEHNIYANMEPDRKSTRLNSSHVSLSYAVLCFKKKK